MFKEYCHSILSTKADATEIDSLDGSDLANEMLDLFDMLYMTILKRIIESDVGSNGIPLQKAGLAASLRPYD